MPYLSRAFLRLLCVLPASFIVLLVVGCGGSSGSSSSSTTGTTTTTTGSGGTTTTTPTGPTANTGAAQRIYVVQQPSSPANGTILQFAATATGSATPASTITPGTPVAQVATDKLGNIYFFNGNIVEYAAGATGSPTALRQISSGTTSRICCVDGLGVSPDGAIVLGQDNGEIDEWSATATGSVAPSRYLGYSETGGGASLVGVANQVAGDASDTLYVGAAGAPRTPQVLVFSPTASGNVAPTRSLGPNGLAGGLAVDSAGNVYITSSTCTAASATSQVCNGTISVYAAGTASTDTPTRVITGSSTQLGALAGIKVDAVGNMYVVSTTATGTNPTVLMFAATASGNVAPSSSFTSTAWTAPGSNPSIAIY